MILNNPFFNQQMLLNSLMGGIRQRGYGQGYADGVQDGAAAGQARMLAMLGLTPASQLQGMQQLLGSYGMGNLQQCSTGCVPRPTMDQCGPPAGKGLQTNPPGWPEGSVRTAGGYTMVPEGHTSWKIFGPDQKPTDKPLTHVHGDPHVDQKDGTRWDFTKNGDFVLPDGTRINCETSSETGYSVSKALNITCGMDRVSVTGLDGKPTTSGVTHDGYEWRAKHLAGNPNRDTYRMGGDGDDWFLERGGKDLGKITGAYMDHETNAYQQVLDGGAKYTIDPKLRPQVGSEAWGNMLRSESLDRIAQMGMDPAQARQLGQMYRMDHAETQLQNGMQAMQFYNSPWGQMFSTPKDAMDAVGNMGDALKSLMMLNRHLNMRRSATML